MTSPWPSLDRTVAAAQQRSDHQTTDIAQIFVFPYRTVGIFARVFLSSLSFLPLLSHSPSIIMAFSKEEQFIGTVQTALTVFYLSGPKYSAEETTTQLLLDLEEAYRRAKSLPAEKSAHEAAVEFLHFVIGVTASPDESPETSKDDLPSIPKWKDRQ